MPNYQDKNHRKYILYLRKSSESEDKQAASIPAQRNEMEELIKRENLNVVATFEESQSAHSVGRPLFNQMVKMIDDGKADAILVWHLNRIARNALDGGMIIYLLDVHKLIEIRTKTNKHDGSGNDKFMLQIEFAMSKKYSDDLGEIVKRGNKEKFFERREWVGFAKPGYLNLTDPLSKKNYLDIDPIRFPLLKQAIDLILSGTHTPMQALDVLNNDFGYKTKQTMRLGGGPLSKSAWYRMLNDTFYYGLMRWSGNEIIGIHKPMITEEEFNLLQIRLGKKGKPHRTEHEYAYKSILKCGECGGSITCQEKWHIVCDNCKHKFARSKKIFACPHCHKSIEEMKKPVIRHYLYYTCTKKVHKDCSQGAIEVNVLEESIKQELNRFEIPEEFVSWAVDNLHEVLNVEEKSQNEIHDNLLSELNKNDQKIKSLMRLRISVKPDSYTPDIEKYYDDEQARLFLEKNNLQEKLKNYSNRQEDVAELTKETFNFACHARYRFDVGAVQEKTEILSKLGKNLTIKDRKLVIQGEKPFFLIEKARKEIKVLKESLEPDKRIVDPSYLITLEPVKTIMRRHWDLNPGTPKGVRFSKPVQLATMRCLLIKNMS